MKKCSVKTVTSLLALVMLSAAGAETIGNSGVPAVAATKASVSSKKLPYSLKLKGVDNARKITGLIGTKKRKLKANKLLRTGKLYTATKGDLKTLTKKYHLTDVIDLRGQTDATTQPDPKITDVKEHVIDLYGTDFLNDLAKKQAAVKENLIAQEGKEAEFAQEPKYIEYMNWGGSPTAYVQNFSDVMRSLASSKNSQQGYRQVFKVLLKSRGATDIHCTSGKDRTGTTVALVLSALGVSRKQIKQDYLLSNNYYEKAITARKQELAAKNFPQGFIDAQNAIIGVSSTCLDAFFDEIDTNYGSTKSYLINQVGLTNKQIKQLQNKFLK
ncbi:tyrosine-protein phosphatase [Lactobacillus sp. ESL0785]|uniref:tyrosine-protein phosphatase n=1 Tax=Lactobacillus sp. ESL0785 TaxID=2983232 RepID=UPI0023FA0920|nr:tyrosine-protein phosphatase [Lactobacillus sp. ESL0785]WEV71316.1 tyrosine-protein phosphatase [Lactobacillus sp. ESL0785]